MKLILDLCGGTGAWSKPYADAGYDVRVIDLPNDIRLMPLPRAPVHGILAAPPCTYFCRMRMCRGRPVDGDFLEALSVVDACLRFVAVCQPKWWAIENPEGYLSGWLGHANLKFDPCDFGDPWTKRTWLWGHFTEPKQNWVKPKGPWIHRKKGSRGIAKTDAQNAITPPGFARAFFEANP